MKALIFISVFVGSMSFAQAELKSMTCACKCDANWIYELISVSTADVGLPDDADESSISYRSPQACEKHCLETTGSKDSYVRTCWGSWGRTLN